MQKLLKHVSERIRFYRKAANLTQEELSELLNIDRSYIGKIERGEVNASLDTIERIALALKVDPFELFHKQSKGTNKDKRDFIEKINIILTNQKIEELKMLYDVIRTVQLYKNIK
ncbi:helix-turn-helix domain-containing protein [Paenibacillus sp. WQ 127069]|uniref:Helix-turn-helix domain-containing protein n=1 Tax=Paenibacillus baimaensis TaxID=2982185 RepID=A0ABT2UBA1_9BACL|nr:helix-turn-helix transcriptional regulator [Paenibacillus sp. WQ 127069]MCU6791908.1 helix-turn-helix domain-containing protein [Paenibacillus sp. WQ 127069]